MLFSPILDSKLVITVFCALINDDVIGRLDNNTLRD